MMKTRVKQGVLVAVATVALIAFGAPFTWPA
jgi:hypothetical protein